MLVQELLLEALENLVLDDFRRFQWFLSLSILDGCSPIPKSRLEAASRQETVDKMMQSYAGELPVSISVEILKKMKMNNTAEELRSRHAATDSTSSSSSSAAPPAAPPHLTAQQGGVIVAPTIAGSTTGSWTVTIHK